MKKSYEVEVNKQFPIEEMKEMEEMLKDVNGWKTVDKKKNATLFSRIVDGKFWVRTCINNFDGLKINDLYQMFLRTELRSRLSKRIVNVRLIERKENYDIVSYEIILGLMISNRQILQVRRWKFLNGKDEKDGFVVCLKSVVLDDFPEVSNPVRASKTSVRRFFLKDGKASLLGMECLQMNGWLPETVVNKVIVSQNKKVYEKMKQAISILKMLEEEEKKEKNNK